MDFGEPKKKNGPSEVVFHRHIFQQILMKARTKKIAFLSIAGPSRKGKSFFLNYILRFLNGKKNNRSDWMKKYGSNEHLTGFTWKNSADMVTSGIWLWSEPLTMKSTNGEEFDLLIMDTQGVFDEHTTQREWSILVGLGLLASSCLIFNIVGDLQEDRLQIFEKFLEFGLMAFQDDGAKTPFQNLVFLIRDWNVPGEYPYGFNGGRKYLNSKLDTKSSHKDSHTKVRQQLKECFEDISCCLLPHPGEEAFTQNFDGFVDPKNDRFAAEVEKCISELINTENIPAKKINGNDLSGTEILETFSKYCDFFNSDEIPSPESIFQVMAKHSNDLVIKKCVEKFTNKLNMHIAERPLFLQDDLIEVKRTAERSCLEIFDNSRKIGDQSMLKLELLGQIEESFTIISEKNAHNLQIIKSKAFDSAAMEYKAIVSHGMEKGYLSNSDMDSLLLESKKQVLESFASSCGVVYIDLLPDSADKFHQFIISKNIEFKNQNALSKYEEEKEIDAKIQNLVALYVENMEDRTKGRIVSENVIHELHEINRKHSLNDFDALKVHPDFVSDADRNLKTRIDNQYERICKDILSFNEKMRLEGNSLITQAGTTYFNSVKANITANKDDFEQLQKDSSKLAQKTLKNSIPVEDEFFLLNLYQLLQDEIDRCNLNLKDIFERNEKEFMIKLRDAQEDAIKVYLRGLDELLPKTHHTPVMTGTLEETHTQELQKATQSLETCFQRLYVIYKGVDKNLFEKCKSDVKTSINNEYDSIKQLNALRLSQINALAADIFTKSKESYVNRIKEAGKHLTNEEKLRWEQSGITKDLSENLKRQLGALNLPLQQQENFLKDFHSYIEIEFEGTIEVCRLKMEEDELIVKTAFLDAREYYKDEMEKHFQSADWLEVLELQKLHDMIIKAAIERGRKEVDISVSQEVQLRELIHNLFKKYQDKNLLRMPTDDYAIGIDLGTTYSCVAVCIKGKVTVISQNGNTTIPSYVAFKEDRTIDVGDAAKEQTFRRPECTIFDAKRLIGRKFSDKIVQDDIKLWPFEVVNSSDQPKIKIPGHSETYYPEQISARVLVHMKNMAEDYLNKKVKNAVVTVPAYFSESQRQATKDAAQIAGLNAKILNEPTAAAISYELHRTDDFMRNVLIFDLGGGTFDCAVLKMNGGEITVKAIKGDTHLGGEDFDNEMVMHIIGVVKEKHDIDLGRGRDSINPKERRDASERLRRIRAVCEKQKRILSSADSVEIEIPRIDGSFNLEETFTRAEFEILNLSRFKNCIDITVSVISDAQMDKSEIDDIVLIGGSTRIPKIRELLTEYFDGKALNKQINADEAVAYGAAIKAALIYGKSNEVNKNVRVKDVTPMSLGVEIFGGGLSVIIEKNTPVPYSKAYPYYTVFDWQTSVRINVFEGEKPKATMNNKLGTFDINDIPSAPTGKEPIDISMTIDSEGILHVKAVCRSTGNSEGITIEEHKGRMSGREIQLAQVQ